MRGSLYKYKTKNLSYPNKPEKSKDEFKFAKLLLSILLFFGAAYFIFDGDLFFIGVLILVLIIHELGHFLLMKYYKYENIKMIVIPFFGAAVYGEKDSKSQKEEVNVLFAGPLPGIFIGVILYFIGLQIEQKNLEYISLIFIFINVFNLLPITPLDGGRILQNLFFSNKFKIQLIFSVFSIITSSVLALYFGDYFLLVIPALLILSLLSDIDNNSYKERLNKEGIDCNKTFEELSNQEYWEHRMMVIASYRKYGELANTYGEYENSKKEKNIANYIRTILIAELKKDTNITQKAFYILIWVVFMIIPFFILFG